MAGQGKGVIGSIAVHIGILGAIVGFSWYASRHAGTPTEAVDPLLVDLNGIPGKRAGQVGKTEGVSKGQEDGSKLGVPLVHIKKLDVAKIEQEREKADQAAHSEPAAKPMSKAPTKPGSSGATGKASLNDFLNSKGGKSGSGKTGGIVGVGVKQGRNYGTGDNGGDGGSASEQQLYAGEVLARFRSAWTDIIAAEGGTIASAGSCGVTLSVDAAGNVSFSGWLNRPKDTHMVDLVRRACSQIGNCGKPPSGKTFKIDFPKVGVSEG